MAKWSITYEQDGRSNLTYTNLRTLERFHCGKNRADTPLQMIVDWISVNGEPGDWIALEHETVMIIQQPGTA